MNVAVTPHGNADSPTPNEEGDVVFVKPWEESQSFAAFVDFVSQQELRGRKEGEDILYAQTRQNFIPPSPYHSLGRHSYTSLIPETENDNLRNEYSSLFSSVEKDIPFARIALQQDPDAINLVRIRTPSIPTPSNKHLTQNPVDRKLLFPHLLAQRSLPEPLRANPRPKTFYTAPPPLPPLYQRSIPPLNLLHPLTLRPLHAHHRARYTTHQTPHRDLGSR